MSDIYLEYTVPGNDFSRAGEASANIKTRLKKLGLPTEAIRRTSIAVYEGEINLAIHANNGGQIFVDISPSRLDIIIKDTGPGIADVSKAMQEGYSTAPDEVRSLGFGAGMGLPNMRKYADEFDIASTFGIGTTITMAIVF